MPVRKRRVKRGRGVTNSGSGIRRTGCGVVNSGSGRRRTRRTGGSMRHFHGVPTSIRKKKVSELNKIVKSAKSGKKSRGSVLASLKGWLSNAHKTAKKYNLYEKGARLGLNIYNARKGSQKSIGYNNNKHPVRAIQNVD